MAAVTVLRHRSLIGRALEAYQARARRHFRVSKVARKVREHVLTVASLTAMDIGAFHVPAGWGTVAGFIVTGLSLLVLDFAVTEEQ